MNMKWTKTLAAAGVISCGAVANAEESPNQVLTALSSTTLSGYLDTSAIWKFGEGTRVVGRAFDGTAKQDGFNLNVVAISLSRPPGEDTWAAGYNATLLFGPDAVGFNHSVGAMPSDMSLKDAYVALRAPIGNGVLFKLGTWDKIIGYEAFHNHLNPNFSRSYGFVIGPGQNTGLLASYDLCESLSASAGVANARNVGVNVRASRGATLAEESEKAYTAALTFRAPDEFGFLKGASMTVGGISGFAGAPRRTQNFYVGAAIPTPIKGLSVGVSHDRQWREDGGGVDASHVNATALYLLWQATEKLVLNQRFDYASGSTGTLGYVTGSGENNELFSYTVTVDYKLWANVVSRAEFRWDHDLSDANPFGNNDENAASLALNVVYLF
jgi:hypothetical protein